MKSIKLIIIMTLLQQSVFAQIDSLIIPKFRKPIESCERVTTNSQKLLSTSKITEFDKISQILKNWEEKCGNVEPVQRAKLLFAIYNQTLLDTLAKQYIDHYLSKYSNRVQNSKKANYQEIFISDKTYYDYVPLNSEFDKWLEFIAVISMKKQDKGSHEYLLCVLFSGNLDLFYEEIKKPEYEKNHIVNALNTKDSDSDFNNRYTLMVGRWIPLGRLQNIVQPGHQVGVKYGRYLYEYGGRIFLEGEFLLNFMNSQQDFQINIEDSIQNLTPRINFILNFVINYKIASKPKYDIGSFIGLGTSGIESKAPSSLYGISAFNLSLGINIKRKISKNKYIGLETRYNYAPYKQANDNLITNIGSQSISSTLFFQILN